MLRKNTAGQHFCFALVNASTGAALTGATVSAYRSIDGAAQVSATGTVTETANGQYSFAPSQADTNGNQIGFLFIAASAIPLNINIVTTACDPTSTAFGLSLAKTTNLTGFNDLAGAAIATAVWTDTTVGDFATASSPGKILVTQLGGAFSSTSSSVYSTASLANAPTGGSAPTVSQIATAVWQDLLSGTDFGTTGSVGALVKANTVASVTAAVTVTTIAGQAPPTNWSRMAIDAGTGGITVNSNNDKTGYSLAASQMFSTTGSIGSVMGAVNGTVTVGGYASGQDPATVVLNAPAASYRTPNSVGAMFSTQGTGTTGSDPWATPLAGNYPPGTAGAILGGNLDTKVSSIKNKTDGLPTAFPANFQTLAVDATTGGVSVLVNQDKSGYNLGSAGLDAIQVENGINARQALSPILAASAGLVSGAGSGTIMITGGNTSVTRILATTDKLGNRSAVTLTLPSATAGGMTTTASSYFPTSYFPTSYFPIGKSTQPVGNVTS
jgi:hypothetical protein